jgi:hypothetical protein
MAGMAERTAGPDARAPWVAVALLLSGAAVLALVLLHAPPPVRAAPVLGYLALVPGLACVRLIRLGDARIDLLLGVTVSLALGVIVAQVLLIAHHWSPVLGLAVLVGIASLAAIADLIRRWRPRAAHRRPSWKRPAWKRPA